MFLVFIKDALLWTHWDGRICSNYANYTKFLKNCHKLVYIESEQNLKTKQNCIYFSLKKIKNFFIYLFLERGEGTEKERRNINVWLPLMRPLLGTWHATQACALTRNWTSDPLVHRPEFNPLSHTSWGDFNPFVFWLFKLDTFIIQNLENAEKYAFPIILLITMWYPISQCVCVCVCVCV